MAKDWNKEKYVDKPEEVERLPSKKKVWIFTVFVWIWLSLIVILFAIGLSWLVFMNIAFIILLIYFYFIVMRMWKVLKMDVRILHIVTAAVLLLFALGSDYIVKGVSALLNMAGIA